MLIHLIVLGLWRWNEVNMVRLLVAVFDSHFAEQLKT